MKRFVMVLIAVLGLSLGQVSPAGDFDGDGTADIAVLRQATGLWAVRGVTRLYYGGSGDSPVDGDYAGTGTDLVAIFRSSTGLWAIRGLTRAYFGTSGDGARTGDYNGDGTEDMGLFRSTSGLWAVRGVTRAYFGDSGDFAIRPDMPRRSGGLLKTGQIESYQDYDDGYYEKGLEFRYTDNGDGTITDNVTGLMWPKDGNDAGCRNGATYTWNDAIDWAYGLDFAEYTDWRLPNVKELSSLADYGRTNPAINSTYFPNTKAYYYWSSTTVKASTICAACVNFKDGDGKGQLKVSDTYYLRAVRGGR